MIPFKGEKRIIPAGKLDATYPHWVNFIECLRSRQNPASDVEAGNQVQVALNMAMLSLLQRKAATFDPAKEEIVL